MDHAHFAPTLVASSGGQSGMVQPRRRVGTGVWNLSRRRYYQRRQQLHLAFDRRVARSRVGVAVRSWKRTWALQIEQGTVFDVCLLNVSLSYTDSGAVDFTYPPVTLAAGELEEEFRHDKQLASSVGMTLRDTQGLTVGTGRGFSLRGGQLLCRARKRSFPSSRRLSVPKCA